MGRAAVELGQRVHGCRSAADAVAAAVAWAHGHIAGGAEVDAGVLRALDAIAADGGAGSIAVLDAWQGRSRARFGAAFRDSVGVTPKRFARLVRFSRAVEGIRRTDSKLSDIALAAGYYDQAHFTADFRAHAGLSPRAYLRAQRFPGSASIVDDGE